MKRKIYLVSDYNTENSRYSIDRAFVNFEDALRYFKARIAEVLIFDRIHSLALDEELANGENMFDRKSIFTLTGLNTEVYTLPKNKESFENDFAYEVRFECDSDTFILKEIEEE